MRRIYVAGRISAGGTLTAAEMRQNAELFVRAEMLIRKRGDEPVNPAHRIGLVLGGGLTWEQVMALDIVDLLQCEGIVLLPGWRKSKGASLEREIAYLRGMDIEEWPEGF